METLAGGVGVSSRWEKVTCCGTTFHTASERRQPSSSQRSWAAPVRVREGFSDSGPGYCQPSP